jgi:hypothetical protein
VAWKQQPLPNAWHVPSGGFASREFVRRMARYNFRTSDPPGHLGYSGDRDTLSRTPSKLAVVWSSNFRMAPSENE